MVKYYFLDLLGNYDGDKGVMESIIFKSLNYVDVYVCDAMFYYIFINPSKIQKSNKFDKSTHRKKK